MAWEDYNKVGMDLGNFISQIIMRNQDRTRQANAWQGAIGANTQTTYPTDQLTPEQQKAGMVAGVHQHIGLTPPTDPGLMKAIGQLDPQQLNAFLTMRQQATPQFKDLGAATTYGTVEPSTGQFTPQGVTQPKPTGMGMKTDWQMDMDAQGKPIYVKVPGTNATRVQEFKNQYNPMTQKYEKITRLSAAGSEPQGNQPNSQLDKSYQFHTSQISSLAKPLQDRVDRMERLQTSLDQKTPQADALIAPELLTAMAGGQGSGLRMNEAEISRIVGGRNVWQDLKSTLMKLQTDPDKPFQILDNQRTQIQALINAMNGKIQEKNNAIIDAQQKLSEAKNPDEHKKIFSDLRKKIAGEGGNQPKVGDVKTFPNGNKGKWNGTSWIGVE